MTTKSSLQLPILNAMTQQVRQNFKGMAGDDAATTKATIARSTRNVVKAFSKLKVDEKDVTGADKATVDEAVKWGDRVARPFELGVKYGATAANAWDYALSFLLGRGVKGLEQPTDLQKVSGDKQTRSAQKANNWIAFRQEGLLGMLTRIPAGALGSLVGRCFANPEKAQVVQKKIRDATIGFNAAVRAATLAPTATTIMFTGVLVGTGVSALAALVAVPTLMRLKTDDPSESAPPSAKPKQATGKAAQANNAAATQPLTPSDVQALGTQAQDALKALQKKTLTPLGRKALELHNKAAATLAELQKHSPTGPLDPDADNSVFEAASKKDAAAQAAFAKHFEPIEKSLTQLTELKKAYFEADAKFTEAKKAGADAAALRPLAHALDATLKKLAAAQKKHEVAYAMRQPVEAEAQKAVAAVRAYRDAASGIAGATILASEPRLGGAPWPKELSKIGADFEEVEENLRDLHHAGIIESPEEILRTGVPGGQAPHIRAVTHHLQAATTAIDNLAALHADAGHTHAALEAEILAGRQQVEKRFTALAKMADNDPAKDGARQAAQDAVDDVTVAQNALHAFKAKNKADPSTLAAAKTAHWAAGVSLMKLLGGAYLMRGEDTSSADLLALHQKYTEVKATLANLEPGAAAESK